MNKADELFIDETDEVLNQLEESLLNIQSDQFDQELHNAIFRMLHTIKGSLYMFDRKELGDFTHKLESIFDEFNETQHPLSEDLIQLCLNAVDFIRETFHEEKLQTDDLKSYMEMLLDTLSSATDAALGFVDQKRKSKEIVTSIYYLVIKPIISINEHDNHPLHYIVRDLSNDNESLVHLETKGTKIQEWRVIFVSEMNEEELKALFLFVEEDLKYTISRHPLTGVPIASVKLDEFKVKLAGNAQVLLNELKEFSDLLIAEETNKQPIDISDHIDIKKKENVQFQQAVKNTNYIKVEQSKIDDLMNWVSELVTIQGTLKNQAEASHAETLLHVSDSIHFITENLRDTIFSISLVPLKTLETRFDRLVRDLSQSLDKKILFQSAGFETELDRKVIANLTDPLLHILRNCIDHGIEPTEERIRLGKKASGRIHLESYYSGNLVFIEISDDGSGIDPKKIRKKAEENGLLNEGDNYSDEEIIQLVFHPGLSTTEQISDISGRGIGMDVVRRKIQELRGEVSISSELGRGTKIIIKLPLSLSILEGLYIKVGETHLVMPMNTIRKIHRIDRKRFNSRPKGSDLLEIDGKQMSVVSIEEKYKIASSDSSTVDVIIVNVGNNEKGVAVDEIKGQVHTVLKPLGDYYEKQDFILGGTILGDGNLAFVLDMEKLIN